MARDSDLARLHGSALEAIWGPPPSLASPQDVARLLPERANPGRGSEGRKAAWPRSRALPRRHQQVPIPGAGAGAAPQPREAAGWMRHPRRAERENKWHSSVPKLKRKQGASTFHDNYQILGVYCSFPAPKTLLGAPAVLIVFCAPLPGPEVLFQDKGSSSVFVLVSHQHSKPSSPTVLGAPCFVWKLRGIKNNQTTPNQHLELRS